MNIGLWVMYIPILLFSDVTNLALVRIVKQEKKKLVRTLASGQKVSEFP